MIAHLDLMMREFEDNFQHAKKRRGHTDDLNQGPDSSFHFVKAGGVMPLKSGLTVGRTKTMMVKTPRIVPNGNRINSKIASTMVSVLSGMSSMREIQGLGARD